MFAIVGVLPFGETAFVTFLSLDLRSIVGYLSCRGVSYSDSITSGTDIVK